MKLQDAIKKYTDLATNEGKLPGGALLLLVSGDLLDRFKKVLPEQHVYEGDHKAEDQEIQVERVKALEEERWFICATKAKSGVSRLENSADVSVLLVETEKGVEALLSKLRGPGEVDISAHDEVVDDL